MSMPSTIDDGTNTAVRTTVWPTAEASCGSCAIVW
jgi:hypothetical protein